MEEPQENDSIKAKNLRFATGMLMFFGIFVLALGAGFFYFSANKGEDIQIIAADEEKIGDELVVHVDGAVVNPGVYSVPAGSRMGDVVKEAGGLAGDADSARINLAAKVTDGQKVMIAKVGQATVGTVAGISTGTNEGALVSINNGSEAQLDSLPGVGPVTVGKIIAARPYVDINELVSKRVVGASTFAKIKDLVTVD